MGFNSGFKWLTDSGHGPVTGFCVHGDEPYRFCRSRVLLAYKCDCDTEPQLCHVFYVTGMKLGVDIEG